MATTVDARDTQYNIDYPRNTQKTFQLILSAPITARTITWLVKSTDKLTTLLTKTPTLNSGSVVAQDGVTYPANQVATLIIAATDCTSTDPTTGFPERAKLYHAFHLTGPAEVACWGYFTVITEP